MGRKRAFASRRIQSSHRFPYGYLVTTSPQSKTPPWYAAIRPPKAFVALVWHGSHGWDLVRCFGRNPFPGCDGRCVQGPGTYSPRHADPRLLAIPTSCSRVAENNPNWGNLSGFAPPYSLASHCNCHCSTCVAQPIRAMRTWRHPHLPPVYHWQSLVSAARTFSLFRSRFWQGVLNPLRTTPPGGSPECRVFLVKRASSNQTKAHTRKCFVRKDQAPRLLTALLRAGTQLVALARHSAPRRTSVAKTWSLGACLSNTKRGFRSL